MKKLTVSEQEELFAQDCKLINLRYEYSGFTGTEKWAIVTELSEEALWDKYRNTNINCSELYKAYSYLPEVPPIIEGSLLLSTAFRFDEVAKYPFTDAMRTIFGINQMDIFVGLGGKQVSCALLVPDIENALLSCQNIVIYTQFGSNNVKFQMAGAIGLSCFPGLKFYVNAEFTLTNVSISASTMPTSVYQIPNTKISICNCGLELGFGKSGINIGAMSQINIRNLMWYMELMSAGLM